MFFFQYYAIVFRFANLCVGKCWKKTPTQDLYKDKFEALNRRQTLQIS